MPQRRSARRGNLAGILAVGVGAIGGTILGIHFLASKNPIGLLGPILGAAVGGFLHRHSRTRTAKTMGNSEAATNTQADTTENTRPEGGPAIGAGVAFLVLGPVMAGLLYWLMQSGNEGHPPFIAIMLFGITAGVAGFTGSMFLTRRRDTR